MDYTIKISQSVEEFQLLEKHILDPVNCDHVRFIRLLKAKQAKTQKQAGDLVNPGLRQARRIWKSYCQGGIEALTKLKNPTYPGKPDTTQITRSRAYLQDDQAHSLADMQAYLAGSLGVKYTIGGVHDLCKRPGIKKKTGRPVHIHQQPGVIDDYKKNSGL